MITPLRVLLLADEQGAKSLRREWRRGDLALHFSRAATSEQLHQALAIPIWDVVIYHPGDLPFDAHTALAIVAQAGPPLPFVLMTGNYCPDVAPTGPALEDGVGYDGSEPDAFKLGSFVREICQAAKVDAQRPLERQKLCVSRETVDAISQGILIANGEAPEYTINYVNRAFERISGFTAEELLHTGLRVLQAPRAGSFPCDAVYSALNELRPTQVIWPYVNEAGMATRLSLVVRPLRDADMRLTHFMLVLTDRSESNCLEEQLRTEPWLDRAGRFDAELKDLLVTIRTYSAVLQREALTDSAAQDDLLRIREASERIERLTTHLLTMSDGHSGEED